MRYDNRAYVFFCIPLQEGDDVLVQEYVYGLVQHNDTTSMIC